MDMDGILYAAFCWDCLPIQFLLMIDPFKFVYIWLSNSTSENIYQGKILKYHKNAPYAYD